jgi:hypothetical protein
MLANGMTVPGVVVLVLAVVAVLLHSAVSSALNTILLAALYQFAAKGTVAPEYDRSTFEQAFTPKTA